MQDAQIISLYSAADVLEVDSIPGHDLWVNTARHDADDWAEGRHVRIYSWQGSYNFDKLHMHFHDVMKNAAALNDVAPIVSPAPDIAGMERVSLIDRVADQSVLTVFRDNAGHLGVQTTHCEYDDLFRGPVVWLCAPLDRDAPPALKKRAEVFAPLFGLTETLAACFNQPEPGR